MRIYKPMFLVSPRGSTPAMITIRRRLRKVPSFRLKLIGSTLKSERKSGN